MQSTSRYKEFETFLRRKLGGKRVLILGFGKEGKSTFKLLSQFLDTEYLLVADQNQQVAKMDCLTVLSEEQVFTDSNYQSAISGADIVVKSPGVKIEDGYKSYLVNTTSQTDLFLQFYKEQVIGVTGTKGKSTTASLVYHILSENGMLYIIQI